MAAEGLVGLGQVEADLAMADLLLGGADGVGQLEGFFGRAAEQVMGQPLGGLGADAGQASQGGDQTIDGRRVARARHVSVPRPPGPAAAPPKSGKRPSGRPPVKRRERLGRRLAGLDEPGVDRRGDQVFEQLGVAIGDQLGVDPHRHDLEPAVDLDRDRTAAGGPFHFELAERFERLVERLAQLAGVPHQFREHSQLIEHA